jgi:hypothetical protein
LQKKPERAREEGKEALKPALSTFALPYSSCHLLSLHICTSMRTHI